MSLSVQRLVRLLIYIAMSALISGDAFSERLPGIVVSSYDQGEVVRYPVVLLQGSLEDHDTESIRVINETSKLPTRSMSGLVHEGDFKVLAELVPGPNNLVLKSDKCGTKMVLIYQPMTNSHKVRMFYFVGKEGDTRFHSPVPDDPCDFEGKFDTALKLMQTFTAEEMHRHGYGRRTFNLEFDENGRVITHVLKSPLRAKEYWKKDGINGDRLYDQIQRLIDTRYPDPKSRNIALIGISRFDPETGAVHASAALGGGNLAIFGGTSLFSWPDSLAEVQRAFMDDTMVNTKEFFSDSIGRNTYWATASTCIGCTLHELGHAFALPHTKDYPTPIMQRGGDLFNRYWTFVEPPHARRKESHEFAEDKVAQWAPVSAAAIACHRFLALDDKEFEEPNTISIDVDEEEAELVVKSDYGLGFIGIEIPGAAKDIFLKSELDAPARKEVRISADEIGRVLHSDNLTIRVVDVQGHMLHRGTKAFFMSYLRKWRVAKAPDPRESSEDFPELGSRQLKGIAKSAASTDFIESSEIYTSFDNVFPEYNEKTVAAFAVRELVMDKPARVKIYTGSGSNFRLWLDGETLTKIIRTGWPVADMESTSAELREGVNVLIAECLRGEKSWSLFVRFADEDDTPLELRDDGRLVPKASNFRRGLLGASGSK